jgi:hypothetical protein
MIRKEIYPKTMRVPVEGDRVQLTEKLDGSNLVIFNKDGEIYFAQRSTILSLQEVQEIKEVRDKLYGGLYQWIINNGQFLKDNLCDGSAICGEWLGMGKIKYTIDKFDKRFYMFAKANIDDDFELYNLIYNHELFIYPFTNQEIPSFIGIVPVVTNLRILPDKQILDSCYAKYCTEVNRPVEGFVISYRNTISKYVRMKNNKVIEYSDNDHKGI